MRIECPECYGQGTVPLDGVDVMDCERCNGDGEIQTDKALVEIPTEIFA